MRSNMSSFMRVDNYVQPQKDFPVLGKTPIDPNMDFGLDFSLPFEKVSLFARHIDSGEPISRLPVYATAGFDLTAKSYNLLGDKGKNISLRFPKIPLGVIGTDHVGYGSFDLWPLRNVKVILALREELINNGLTADIHVGGAEDKIDLMLKKKGTSDNPRLEVTLSELIIMPFKDPTIAFDAIAEGDYGPDFICLRMDLDEIMLADRPKWPQMPAMQTPDIIDWRLSPGSFSMSSALLIGEEGCERLLPTNLATKLIRFRQIIRTMAKAKLTIDPHTTSGNSTEDGHLPEMRDAISMGPIAIGSSHPGDIRFGYEVQYNIELAPLGHSLGQIAYSLPLAPGEKIKIAIIDWSRHDAAKREEQTSEKEDLQHAALRDRSLSEAVSMVVQENQSGSSFMAGGALSAGAGIAIGPVSLGLGGAFGLGGSSTDSAGARNLVANTIQQISDAFHQASSAQRELNSTVVVQSDQTEAAQAQTRIIANYNHSHALTILYYEVLQHQRLITRPASIRPVLFVPYGSDEFDYDLIERFRSTILGVLLDESLRGCFDVVAKRQCKKYNFERNKKRLKEHGDPLDDLLVGVILITYTTGAKRPQRNVRVSLITKEGNIPISCNLVEKSLTWDGQRYLSSDVLDATWWNPYENVVRVEPNSQFVYAVKPSLDINWKNVKSIQIAQFTDTDDHFAEIYDWELTHVRATTISETGTKWVMVDVDSPGTVPLDTSRNLQIPVNDFVPPIEDVDDDLSDDERYCLHRLINHLAAHSAYYWRSIWLAETAADRAERIKNWKIGRDHIILGWLLDFVDNTVYDFADGYAVMPLLSGAESAINGIFNLKDINIIPEFNEYIEQIITVPVRGVFAEAKLGQCNSSEIIDPTRFWDWQSSPIPDDAPEIASTGTDSRYQDPTKGLTPTPFPQSIVNIVNPQSLPDPTGMTAGAGVMSALGPFRDMSGIKELGSYLQTLSNNATQLASQGMKNAQTVGLINMIRSAREIPEDKRADLISELLTGQVKKTSQTPIQTTIPATTTTPTGTTTSSSTTTPTETTTPSSTTTPAEKPAATTTPSQKGTTTESKQTSVSKPSRSQMKSSKTHEINFDFRFDTGEAMYGDWTVRLISGGDTTSEDRKMNTGCETSGSKVGDQVAITVGDKFGEGGDVTVTISGKIIVPPVTLESANGRFSIEGWDQPSPIFKNVIARNVFDKTRTIEIIRSTDLVSYQITHSRQGTQTDALISNKSAGLEVGVENTTEASANIGAAQAKDTFKVNAKTTVGISISDQNTKSTTDGYIEQVTFNGRKIGSTLSIKEI